MAVSASPAARVVRTACFAEQMEQKNKGGREKNNDESDVHLPQR
jgi:hypothetical protein